MELALQIVKILNEASPLVAELIVLTKRDDGPEVDVIVITSRARDQFHENLKQLNDFFSSGSGN